MQPGAEHIPVGRLVVVSDQTYHRGEQGVQKRAQHAALWHAGVHDDSGGGEIV